VVVRGLARLTGGDYVELNGGFYRGERGALIRRDRGAIHAAVSMNLIGVNGGRLGAIFLAEEEEAVHPDRWVPLSEGEVERRG
jgi:hypothetical protein